MITQDKKRQKRHRARLEAKIDPFALVLGFGDRFIDPQSFSVIHLMLGELPATVRSKIHLYGIDSGKYSDQFSDLGIKTFQDYGVSLYATPVINDDPLNDHYYTIDVLLVSRESDSSLKAAKDALREGCVVVAKSKIAQQINLAIKDRLHVSDKQCAVELSQHIARLASYRRRFDCAVEN